VIAALATLLVGGATAVPAGSTQLLLVTTADWDAPAGTLTRWERAPGRSWRQVGVAVEVVVGSAGLAWGRGLHPAEKDGRTKREGDRRAPAGVFALGSAWGYATTADPGVRWPYRPITDRTVCVDDPAAAAYNQIAESPGPWKSAEKMRQSGQAYRWLLVVEHNVPPHPGAGSCTFLHGLGRKRLPTRGCTAMEQADLRVIIRWLRPDAHPVLVQAPAAVLRDAAAGWGIPPASSPAPSAAWGRSGGGR